MARRIEHQTTYDWSAQDVFRAFVDETYLRDRLAVLGGTGAELESFSSTDGKTSYQLKLGVSADDLPSIARNLIGGNLVIHRTETWTEADLTGTVEVTVNGVPGRLRGGMRLTDEPVKGSKLTLRGEVNVNIPLVGGKLEATIAEQVVRLLDKEAEFTSEWLANRA